MAIVPGTMSSPGSLFELAKCQKWKSGQWRNAYLHNIIFCQTKVHAVLQSIDFIKIFHREIGRSLNPEAHFSWHNYINLKMKFPYINDIGFGLSFKNQTTAQIKSKRYDYLCSFKKIKNQQEFDGKIS